MQLTGPTDFSAALAPAGPAADRRSPTLVVNFNAPELNQLAAALAAQGDLARLVRPYLNKGRAWERAIARLPLAGPIYQQTFGRRQVADAGVAALTREAGIAADVAAALLGRAALLPRAWRHHGQQALYKSVRLAVAEAARAELARPAGAGSATPRCVVAYEGFALPAFEALAARGGGRAVLNYPVAHHRLRRSVRLAECEREPDFAITWPDFDDWPAGHEERLDAEIALADAVLVGSSYVADSFVAEGVDAAKMKVVPYGVDLATFTPAATPRPERSDFHVIYAGQLTQRKGLSYLLRGYRRFARADSRLTLVGSPVGSSAPLRPFEALFEHVPHQTRPALAQRYREADVFLFPTLIEGMPLVVLEAMACGLPVIVTANGPAGIVRDGIDGFIVPERDEAAIAERLERLYRDRALCRAMGAAAAERAQAFGWSNYRMLAMACLDALNGAAPA
jgi:glycosyltransferase involved in cell wall biosynthesis